MNLKIINHRKRLKKLKISGVKFELIKTNFKIKNMDYFIDLINMT